MIALAVAGPVSADPSEPRGQVLIRELGADEGLRNQFVIGIVQDGAGSLWLGTDDGLFRYDGERFTHFSLEHGIQSSMIMSIGVAPDGRVCAGSAKGLVCWTGSRFVRASATLPEEAVYAIMTFRGRLWIGAASGLYVRDSQGQFARAPGWPGTTAVSALWADATGLVVGNGGAVFASAGDGRWHQLPGFAVGDEEIVGVLRDRVGTLWVRTAQSMRRVQAGSAAVEDVSAGLPRGRDASHGAAAMAIGPRGEVLVATDGGIAYRDQDRWQLIDEAAGFHGGSVRTVFVDREGTTWGGSTGLLQWRGRSLLERHHVSNGLPGEIAWTVKKHDATVWVGTDQCLTRGVNGRWECLPGTDFHEVRSLLFTSDGGMLLGGTPAEILHVDAGGGVTTFGRDVDRPAENGILALAYGPDGDVWVATKIGLYRLPGGRPGPLVRVAIPGVKPDRRFSALLVHEGRVWTATVEGVAVLDDGTWHVFNQSAGFRASSMRYLVARQDGSYCVSYNEAIGVSCFRYHAGAVSAVTHIGVNQGLSTGMVYSLGEDRRQRLWVGTGNGVDVVTPTGIDHFARSDGLAGDDSSATAFFEDVDGSLWIGATGGVTHVFAQYYDGPLRPPAVRVVDGTLGERGIAAMTGAALETSHDRNGLELELGTDSLSDASQIEYQVRLRPSETDWSTTRTRHARYPALPPGDYVFEMRARIDAGQWGPISVLRFTVRAAWWQTRWFFAISGGLVLCAVVALFTRRQQTALRLRTRQLAEQSHARLRALIESMPELVGVYSGPRPVYLNAAARRFFGIADPEQLIAGQMGEVVHVDDRGRFAKMLERAPQVGSTAVPEVVQVRIRDADNGWRILEISGVRVEYDGAPAVITTGRDVTESERLRSKLLVSDRMASLGTLAAGVAHEINNPLAYVLGNLEVIADAFGKAGSSWPIGMVPAELTTAIADATDGAQRVRQIVKGLRSFSRSEEEKRVPLVLENVLEAAIRIAGNQVRHRAQIVRDMGSVPSIIADDGRLTQVFINLLVNAAQAIPDGHSDANQITVRTRTDDTGRAVIEVEDTGAGMPPEVVTRVFDPFFTTKDVGEGAGLGLAICHGIVTDLGGTISVHSEVGRGTIVRVVLPGAPVVAEPIAIEAPARAPTAEPTSARQRVLVVDDDPLVGKMLLRTLGRDYDVTVVTCGEAALEHVAAGAWFDAIVSDVMMPNMAGLELLDELTRLAPDQAKRVIFLSGGVFAAETRQRLDELGTPQLEKPVSTKELRSCVARMIALHTTRASAAKLVGADVRRTAVASDAGSGQLDVAV